MYLFIHVFIFAYFSNLIFLMIKKMGYNTQKIKWIIHNIDRRKGKIQFAKYTFWSYDFY